MKAWRIAFAVLSLAPLCSSESWAKFSAGSQANRNTTRGGAHSFQQISQAADTARSENRDEDAMRLYRQALLLRPNWSEGLWYLGFLDYDKEHFSEARDVLRRFVANDPDAGPGWAVLGLSEFQMHEYSRSLDHLRRAMALGLGGREEMKESVFYFVGVLLTRFEQYNDSMNLFMAMVKSGQQPGILVEPIGLAALRMPLLPAEIPPDRREMIRLAGQGALAVERTRQDEAEKIFSGLVANYPDEPGVHFLYGVVLLDLRPADGIAQIKRELEISPFHIPARLRLAEQYLKDEQLEEALRLSSEAVKLEPRESSGHMMLGEVLVAKGDLSGGVRELEVSEAASPQTVRTHWDLLRAYTTAGRVKDAQREKEEIEKLNAPSRQ